MAEMWTVWMASTNEFVGCDDNTSEVELLDMPAGLQTVGEPGWTAIRCLGIDPDEEPWDDDSIALASVMNLSVGLYSFPDEYDEYQAVGRAIAKRWVFLSLSAVGQEEGSIYPKQLHPTGKCIAVTDEKSWSAEHNHEEATYEKTIKLRRRKPIFG